MRIRLIHLLTCSVCTRLPAVLEAMRDDSEKVPSLLTDYILKGELCYCSFLFTTSLFKKIFFKKDIKCEIFMTDFMTTQNGRPKTG